MVDRRAVLVVGSGPVGLVLACELARRNVPIRVIDKLPAPTTESRAILVHARSLEMLDRIGVVNELIASGVKTVAMEMHAAGRTLTRAALDSVDSPYPFSITTAQTETERILTERLTTLGVDIERGVELTAFTQDDQSVQYTLRHNDGREEQAEASWIAGADGAHSTVRASMGLKLQGSFKGETFLLGDVEAEYSLSADAMHTYFSPGAGTLLVFPMLGQRVRLIAETTDESSVGDGVTLELFQRVLDERAGGIKLLSAHWLTTFEIHHAQVPAYRVGRAFLAGDAAHVHSPAGGQGMNTGMQDAFNLGWKLAAVVNTETDAALLDSYHSERHPIAAHVIAMTTQLTKIGTLPKRFEQELRNHALQLATGLAPVLHVLAAETEETGLNYRGSPIVSGHARHGHPRPGDIAPAVSGSGLQQTLAEHCTGHVAIFFGGYSTNALSADDASGIRSIFIGSAPPADQTFDAVLDDPDARIAKRYGLERGGVILVRPDGYIGYIGDPGDSRSLAAYRALIE